MDTTRDNEPVVEKAEPGHTCQSMTYQTAGRAGWHCPCDRKAKWNVDGLLLCGIHKNCVIKQGDVLIRMKTRDHMERPDFKTVRWTPVTRRIQNEQNKKYERERAAVKEGYYQTALKRVAQVHGITVEELLKIIPERKEDERKA